MQSHWRMVMSQLDSAEVLRTELAASESDQLSRSIDFRPLPKIAQIDRDLRISDNTASKHLPAFEGMLPLDKDVEKAHQRLEKQAGDSIKDPKKLAEFRENMNRFELTAERNNVRPSQVTETYEQLQRILEANGDKPLSPKQREEVAQQWMARLADPSRISQGWHDTCGYAVLEFRLATKEPEKITKLMADVTTDGKYMVPNWRYVSELEANGIEISDDNDIPKKPLYMDSVSLIPDSEASGKSPFKDRRDYADQLAQVMLVKIRYDGIGDKSIDAKSGLSTYQQSPIVQRADEIDPRYPHNTSGERVVSGINPLTGKLNVRDDNGHGSGGFSKESDQTYVNEVITGRHEVIAMKRKLVKGEQSGFALEIKSIEDLRKQLNELTQTDNLPFAAKVVIANPGIVEPFLARSGESKEIPKDAVHFISVTKFDGLNSVEIYDPLGEKRTLTLPQLYQAMTYPEGYSPPEKK